MYSWSSPMPANKPTETNQASSVRSPAMANRWHFLCKYNIGTFNGRRLASKLGGATTQAAVFEA